MFEAKCSDCGGALTLRQGGGGKTRYWTANGLVASMCDHCHNMVCSSCLSKTREHLCAKCLVLVAI